MKIEQQPDAEPDPGSAAPTQLGRCVRDALIGAVFLFLASSLANTVLFRIASSARLASLQDQLRAHAALAARWLDADAVARSGTTDPGSGRNSASQLAILQSLREAHGTLDELNAARAKTDGTLEVLLETHPDKNAEPARQAPTLSQTLLRDVRAAIAYAQARKFSLAPGGEEGLGAVAPVGSSGDFVVARMSARNLNGRLRILHTAYGLALSLSAIVSVLGGLVIYWLRCNEVRARLMRPEDREFFRKITAVLPGMLYQARVSRRGEIVTTYVSDAARWVFELEPSELLPNPRVAFSRLHPEDRKRLLRGMASMAWKPGEWREEFRVKLPRAGERWRFGICNVQRLSDGSTLWNGFITDVTWRKQAEESIRLSERRLQLATRAGKVGTWDYDVATRRIVWNDVMYEMKKLDPATFDLNYDDSARLLHPDDRARVEAEFARCLASGAEFYEIECRIILPDGDLRHTRSSAVIIRDAKGTPVRVVGIEIDVTPQKRAVESALAADRAKSEFLAMMSHEIRTPMNGVLGFTSLLKEGGLTPQQRDYVDTIEASGHNLLHLINDILDLSKVESGRIEIRTSPFHLRNFLQEITGLLRPRAEEKHLDYGWTLTDGAPEHVQADRSRLGQILTNLLGNAVKFTGQGRVWLDVSASPGSDGEWTLRLVITDTGPGIPAEALERVFEPFYQTDLSSSRRHGGTGLGLSISQRLAHLMGGTITLESSVGAGSRFTVVLPVTECAPPAAADPAPPGAFPEGSFEGRRVLVVDDDPVNRRLCVLQISRLGLDVEAAAGGMEAVKRCAETSFSAILMDVQMPGMDGLEATRRIRHQERRRVPVIAFTANVMPDDRDKCLAAGMDDYLAKPLQFEDLAATLRRWL